MLVKIFNPKIEEEQNYQSYQPLRTKKPLFLQ